MTKLKEPMTLTELGLALLLAMADPDLRPPKESRGIPGIRCTYACGELRVTPEGYRTGDDAAEALTRARRVCEDAGLVIVARTSDAFSVRRRR